MLQSRLICDNHVQRFLLRFSLVSHEVARKPNDLFTMSKNFQRSHEILRQGISLRSHSPIIIVRLNASGVWCELCALKFKIIRRRGRKFISRNTLSVTWENTENSMNQFQQLPHTAFAVRNTYLRKICSKGCSRFASALQCSIILISLVQCFVLRRKLEAHIYL